MTPRDYLERILHEGRPAAHRALDPDAAARLPARAWARFEALRREAPSFRDSVDEGLFVLAVPIVALYQALRLDSGVAEPAALRLAEEMLGAAFERTFGPLQGLVWSLGFDIVPLRNLLVKRALRVNEPGGFRFEAAADPSAEVAFDVKRCPITEFARARGAPEVVPMICRLDDAMSAHLRHFTLRRTGTIGTGADRCDFRFVRRNRQ